MAGRNKKTSVIKDIDELEKEKQIEEIDALNKVADISEIVDKHLEENDGAIVRPHIVSAEEVKAEPKDSVNLKKVQVDPWLNVRNKPSMSGSEIIGRVENGDIVEIFAIKDDFAKISETEEKWVNINYLVPVYSKEQLEN